MDNQQDSNVQAAPEAQTPPAAGNQAADLSARVAELERAKEGLIREAQEERRKRHELEQRFQSVPAPSAVPVQAEPDVTNDEVAKVLNPYIAPLRKQNEELMQRFQEDQAYAYLSEKTGKTKAQILADQVFQEKLVKTAQKWGFRGPVHEVTARAYEAMELEDFRAQQQEKTRAAQASAQASLPAGAPPAPVASGRTYDLADFSRMPASEFSALEKKGAFRKEGDKIVYTPRS